MPCLAYLSISFHEVFGSQQYRACRIAQEVSLEYRGDWFPSNQHRACCVPLTTRTVKYRGDLIASNRYRAYRGPSPKYCGVPWWLGFVQTTSCLPFAVHLILSAGVATVGPTGTSPQPNVCIRGNPWYLRISFSNRIFSKEAMGGELVSANRPTPGLAYWRGGALWRCRRRQI